MAEVDKVQLEMTIAEDAAWQIFWTDDYGDPVPVKGPCMADVKDANGQIAVRFSDTADPTVAPYISLNGPIGFFQLTMPHTYSAQLLPGRYLFDLFASVADSSAPFSAQQQQVVTGWMVVNPRVTKIELAASPLLTANPVGS